MIPLDEVDLCIAEIAPERTEFELALIAEVRKLRSMQDIWKADALVQARREFEAAQEDDE